MPDPSAAQTMKHFERLKADRSVFESHWQEIRDLELPVLKAFTRMETPGIKNRDRILDNSAESAAELLTAGLHGLMTNPGTKWFSLRTDDDRLNRRFEVAAWLEDSRDRMFRVFESPQSQFSGQLPKAYSQIVHLGTGGIFVGDRPGRLPLYQTRPLSELLISDSDEGVVDTVYRSFRWSARQALQRFGARTPEKIAKKAETEPEDKFSFIHGVFPRRDRDRRRLDARNMPFASQWISVDTKTEIQTGGFEEFPLAVPRWWVMDEEIYGRGPGAKALPDVKLLQRVMKATVRGLEKTVNPPLLVADDGVIGPIRTSENGINRFRSEFANGRQPPIQPLATGARPDIGEDSMAAIRLRIERAFFNHLLQLSRDPRMTATQVLKLDEETLRVLGPFLGRIQNEMLGPLIERTFNIMLRAGMFLPVPEALQGRRIEIEYESPIARAQRLSEVTAIAATQDVMAQFTADDPTLHDNMDLDLAYRHVASVNGVRKDIMRPPELVERMRQARREEAEQQAQLNQATQLASASQSAGQALAAFEGLREAA